MGRLCIAGAVLLATVGGAVADDAIGRFGVHGFFSGLPAPHPDAMPAEEISCEAQIAAYTAATCVRPCTTWAHAQPDFTYSYEACVANCPKRDFGFVYNNGRIEPCRMP
jgi:hypothetical protein